jgi:hypothetical protein
MNARAFSLIGVAALTAALAAESPKEKKERSPWAGTYTGTYTASAQGRETQGEITLTIDGRGKSTGESFNKTDNHKAKLKGAHLKDNKIVLVFEYDDGTRANAYGTVSKTADGGITGTMIQRIGDSAVFGFEFELHPKGKEAPKQESKE